MLCESRPIRHHGMSYAPSAFPLVINYQYVKEPTILLSEGESTPPIVLRFQSRAIRHLQSPSRYPLASLPTSTQDLRTSCEEERFSRGAAKHPYFLRLLRYSVGSLPAAPPRLHQYEGRSLQVTSSPLCCEVGNRTRHRAKCSISDTSIIQRGATCLRLSFCYPLQTYSHTT